MDRNKPIEFSLNYSQQKNPPWPPLPVYAAAVTAPPHHF